MPPSTARSLLACLCLNRKKPQTRHALVGIFWPEMSEERARRALSQALWQIRRGLPGLLDANSETVSISKEIILWVDTEAFEHLVQPALDAVSPNESLRRNLEQAVELYRADFMDGDYHDWALLERERFRALFLQVLALLGQLEKKAGRYARALDISLRLSRADPLNETAHCEVMRLYQLLDQPEAALRQFELLRRILRQELDEEPDQEIHALAVEIGQRMGKNPAPAIPVKEREILIPAPLIGRESDHAALLHFVDGIFNKLGGLVLVEGEAGVGKTRLLLELARDAQWRGAQVLWGNARDAQALKPYAPLAEALQAGLSPLRLTQIQQGVDKVWLQAILPLLPAHPALFTLEAPPPLPPAQEQERLVEAVVHLFEGWAAVIPLILLLEDLHWADQDTLQLLPILARRLRPFGILIVGSYRGEEARARPHVWKALQDASRGNLLERRVLSRLDESATGELIRRSLGLTSPARLFEVRIFQETDGNPLFVLETLRALQDEGLLQREEGGGWSTPWDETTADYTELPVPPLVEKVITGRLERLPDPLRQTLHVMAALGSQFDFTALAAVAGLGIPATLEAARELIHRSFLRETATGYCFEHDKIHQVVYAEISAKKRVLLHRKIAAHLAETRPAELDGLAFHFLRGNEWEQAVLYNQRAAEAAMSLHANQEARAYLTHALDALDKLPAHSKKVQRADLLRMREAVNGLLGDRAAQKADLEALDALPVSPADRTAQSLLWAEYHEVTGDYPSAIQAAQKAIESAAQGNDLSAMAAGQIILGRALNMQADLQGTHSALSSALENARAAGDAARKADCLQALARFYFDHQDRYEESLACCREALEISRASMNSITEANIRHLMCNNLSDLGQFEEALQEKLAVLHLRRRIGDKRGEAMILYSLAVYYRDTGDDETALKYTRESLAIAEATGDSRMEGYDRTYLGLLLEKSDPHESLRQYTRALEIRRQIGQPALAVDTLAGMARACLQLNQPQQARRWITEALDWVDAHGKFAVGDIGLVYLSAFHTFTATNEPELARQIIQQAYADLKARAATLPDEEARQRFLTNLPQHRQIIFHHQNLSCRQATVCLPRVGDTGQTVNVIWTPSSPEDDSIPEKVARRRHRLSRLLTEAREQGGIPSHSHLADALGVGLRTIERDMAEMKKNHPTQ